MIRHNAEHRRREEELARRIEAAWGVELHRQPELCPFDYVASRDGRSLALIEMKCRGCSVDQHPVMTLDLHKLSTVVEWARWCQLDPLLVTSYTDGEARWLNLAKLDGTPLPIRVIGRTDRADKADREPAVEMPLELFAVLP